ncbi:metallopeptidase family protein [Agromyces sp. H3Y2-19a]|jgi:predicted Zn-dependent protease with MMP-like domain|uniref:metallopeptidase family protein n=1 Tax=Agromyces TaxID=33877 RepID=UPI001E5C5709|nr:MULTISPECIES: metallopeptidase family protein [Agromyces]MCD5348123.1 metallopeptidase family protein [Agromyces sp. S2-1-8]MDF0514273.1 metallopeptidase family protein [Agromyces chromiiresistens]
MVEISDDDFEQMVSEVYDALPDEMVRGLENVAVLIANQPPGERPRLFGLYSGRPLKTRGVYGYGELPDRITLFKNNMQAYSPDLDALRTRVRITLVHEIGHYFGLDDARLGELGWA